MNEEQKKSLKKEISDYVALMDEKAISLFKQMVNAVNDALRPLGAEVAQTPLTPRRLLEAIEAAQVVDKRKAA